MAPGVAFGERDVAQGGRFLEQGTGRRGGEGGDGAR